MTPRDKFLVFGAPTIGEDEIEEVVASLRSGWLGTGPKVARFEDDFKKYEDAPHAVAVSSCTAALHLSAVVAGIGPGDEVITTALTFCATANAIIHTGATPVIVDVDPDTMNIDPDLVRSAITPRTRALIPVHFAGRACDMDALGEIARADDLVVIEDAAHAVETRYKGKAAGTFGDFGCFSFYVTKNVMTAEGGMVLTRDEEHAAQIKVLALHGMSADAWKRFSDEGYKHYRVTQPGYKNNMTDIQASLGIHQLARVDTNWKRRQQIWEMYDRELASLPVGLPAKPEPDTRHAYHLYTIRVSPELSGMERDTFLEAMKRLNIGTGVHYLSLAEHPYYQDTYGWKPERYPNATRIGRETVSLPLSAGLTDLDVSDVVSAVKEVLGS